MGLFPPDFVRTLKQRGIAWFATVSTVKEARAAAAAGADVIIAQGSEAGGHRACFDAGAAERTQVGLFSLLPSVVDAVSLPVVATNGDALAVMIEAEGAGMMVAPGDVDALEDALFRLLDDQALAASAQAAAGRLATKMRWSEAVQPLVEFCRAPRRAPDLLDPTVAEAILAPTAANASRRMGWRQDVRIVQALLSEGGPALVLRKAVGRITRRRAARSGTR